MSKPIVEIRVNSDDKSKNKVSINGIELRRCLTHIEFSYSADDHYPLITLKFKGKLEFNFD